VIVGTGWHLISPMVNSPRRRRRRRSILVVSPSKIYKPIKSGKRARRLESVTPFTLWRIIQVASSQSHSSYRTTLACRLSKLILVNRDLGHKGMVNSKGCQQGGLDRECTYP